MDLGLGNLDDVKQFVLPPALVGDTQYDSVLQIISSSIAGAFESYCNRRFSRVVSDQVTFDALRKFYLLPRFPVETVTKLELRGTTTDAWEDITTAIVQSDLLLGEIYFGCYVGDPICRVRCTYTGGYFYETLEPTDTGYPTAQPGGQFNPTGNPGGSFALADPVYGARVLKGAWLMQCLHEFQAKDRLLPQGLADGSKSRHDLRFEQMQLLPEVQNRIAQYRRMAIA